MAKITALPTAEQLTGEEHLPIVQGADTKRATMASFRDLITPYLQYWYKGDQGDTGASDNTYTPISGGLAAFKASDITRGTASLVGIPGVGDGRVYWTAGDFTGKADDQNVFEADSTPLSVGAWVRPGAYDSKSALALIPSAKHPAIAAGTSTEDHTSHLQALLNASLDVTFPAGRFNISDELKPRSGHRISLSAGTEIRQTVPGKSAFVVRGTMVERVANVHIFLNGGALRGPGGWSNSWTGNSGRSGFRAVRFEGVVACGIHGPGRIYNWGHAAVAYAGANGLLIGGLTIEGTHNYGGPIPVLGNFQCGVYSSRDDVLNYGPSENVTLDQLDISGVAQGFLREAWQLDVPTTYTRVLRCHFHDIPGQHAIYNQDTFLFADGITAKNLPGGSVLKIQSADARRPIRNCMARGVIGDTFAGSLFELATLYGAEGGSIELVNLQGQGRNGGYLISVNGKCRNVTAAVEGTNTTGQAAYVLGNDVQCDITLDAADLGSDGILDTSTNSIVNIWAKLRRPNTASIAGACGIRKSAASGRLILHNPDVQDSAGKMSYGLFNDTAGGVVEMRGSNAVFTGATDTAIRATGKVEGFPTNASLQGTGGHFTSQQNVSGVAPQRRRLTFGSSGNQVIWQQSLSDGIHRVTFSLTYYLADLSATRTVQGVATFRVVNGIASRILNPEPVSNTDGTMGASHGVSTNGAADAIITLNANGTGNYVGQIQVVVEKVA